MPSGTTESYVEKDFVYNVCMNLSSKIQVAVLRGGPSSEYDVSLKTGGHILSTLREMLDVYEPVDIFISKEGEWHHEGLVLEPHRILQHIDVVWNALHGQYGEDGQVQKLLEGLQIPFTGSSAVASALSMDKDMTKRLYRRYSLLTPAHELITQENFDEDQLINIFRNYLHPVIVKPANGGSSIGIRLARTFKELKEVVKHALKDSKRVIVEELIRGKEATCVVIEKAKGERIYALLPSSKSIKFSTEENKQIEKMSKQAHEVLGLRHYSSSDFIITPKKIYILETNSLPTLHEGSSILNSLHNTGWRTRDFVNHVLKLAM